MFKRIRLWWLVLRLESHLGKHDAYLNRLYDTNATTLDDKLRAAKEVLRSPPMDKGERWAEHQKLVGRQMGVFPKEAEPVKRIVVTKRGLMGNFRILVWRTAKKPAESSPEAKGLATKVASKGN